MQNPTTTPSLRISNEPEEEEEREKEKKMPFIRLIFTIKAILKLQLNYVFSKFKAIIYNMSITFWNFVQNPKNCTCSGRTDHELGS